MDDYKIHAEYTGTDPNLHPAASAFARLVKSITNADGSFTDPDLEAEFNEWSDKRKKPADGASASGRDPSQKERRLLHEL